MHRQVISRPARAFSARLRAFSTETTAHHPHVVFVSSQTDARQNVLLGPNAQWPLPGEVSCSAIQKPKTTSAQAANPFAPLPTHSIMELTSPPRMEFDATQAQENYLQELAPSDLDVELTAQHCPKLMQRDLDRIFPSLQIRAETVTVVNLAQQTECDQTAWSQDMETERDKMTASFISAATSICSTLQRCGYWADFIDPSSGRPYLGKFTNTSLFETDDAYRKMGFRIEDLGCCKVLMHATWGSRAFVGTIFTDAPLDSQIIQDMIAKLRDD